MLLLPVLRILPFVGDVKFTSDEPGSVSAVSSTERHGVVDVLCLSVEREEVVRSLEWAVLASGGGVLAELGVVVRICLV